MGGRMSDRLLDSVFKFEFKATIGEQAIGNRFTEMVKFLRQRHLPTSVSNLANLFYDLVGNMICPLGMNQSVKTLVFAAEVRREGGKSSYNGAYIIAPPNWIEMIADDPYMQCGAVIAMASKAKDYWNMRLDNPAESHLVMNRVFSHEAVLLHWFVKNQIQDRPFVPNEYQQQVMANHPAIISSELNYEGRPFGEGPPFPVHPTPGDIARSN
jgi:hypothetical protein